MNLQDISNLTVFYSKSKCHIYNQLITQPKVFNLAFNNNIVEDDIIWNKLIKRNLLMKVKLLVEDYMYKENWNHHDDNVWSLFVHKYAKSMRCIRKIIYVHIQNKDSVTRNTGTLLELKNCSDSWFLRCLHFFI